MGPLGGSFSAAREGLEGGRPAGGGLAFSLFGFVLEQLKAQPGCAGWGGMETRRLSFTEIILRGPCLASGVWVPEGPGWAARLVLSGEGPAFLPAGSWAPMLCAYPLPWTAYEALGFRPVAGNALAKSLESH